MVRRLFLPFLLLLFCFAAAQKSTPAQEKKLPRFEDFPVEEKWNGVAAPIRLQSSADRMYRTNFRNAAREQPNFAGHFRVTTWGCGTDCLQGGVVDLSSGRLLPLPYMRWKADGKWALCGFVTGGKWDEAAQTRTDSRLLIVNCSDAKGADPGGTYLHTSYYVFEKGKFLKIADQIGTERVF